MAKQKRVGAKKAGDAAQAIEIPGVDIKKGMSLMGGNYDLYLQALAAFHADAEEKISEIDASLESGSISLYTTHIHGLRGAAATIGAKELTETAEVLEQAGNRGDWAYIKSHNADFQHSLEALLGIISQFAP